MIFRDDDATFVLGYLKVVKLMVQPANFYKYSRFFCVLSETPNFTFG